MSSPVEQELLDSLKPMLEEAKAEGKWLYTSYQQLWFSPSEIEGHWSRRRFLWGPTNWKLRDPHERLKELSMDLICTCDAIKDLNQRIRRG